MTEGKFYHVYNRGNNSNRIFYEPENYDYFIRRFRFYLDDYVDVYAFCLMKTHFHFLVKIKELPKKNVDSDKKPLLTPIEKAFKDFFISYAKSINKKYHRTGSLFQYKFKRKEIDTDIYLKNLIRYIHYNPLLTGICYKPSDYEYSSYNTIVSLNNTWVKSSEVIDIFHSLNNFIEFHKIFDFENLPVYPD